jgi:Rrf2 family nitric oxide-sensitive transcriptional repressor
MRLSLQTDYSLRTLMYLAMNPGRRHVADIAAFFRISEAHVAKVVNHLSRTGYIRSHRGVGGGVELARPPEAISIGEIVTAVEGDVHLLDCLGMENVCVIEQGCKLKGVLAQAERLQRNYLNSVRLSDVLPYSTVVPLELAARNQQGTEKS